MADFYTSFSTMLDLGLGENVTRALEILALEEAQIIEDEDVSLGFSVERIRGQDTALWIHDDDGNGDPEHVIAYVKRLAGALTLSGRWGFAWSYTCSRACFDAFGGGAHVIDLATGENVDWTDTQEWLDLTVKDGGGDACDH